MKRIIAILSCVIAAACVLCGCGGTVAGGESNAEAVISAQSVTENIKSFLGIPDDNSDGDNSDGDLGNRTPCTNSELYAAEKISRKYSDSKLFEISMLEFEKTYQNTKLKSQNVEVRLKSQSDKDKQVIIGAAYDNGYGAPSESDESHTTANFKASISLGAFESGTSVATLMSIIDYYAEHSEEAAALDFELVFVFFGASNFNNAGSAHYLEKSMTATDRLNTLAFFDIGSMGGEKLYIYADEASTEHEKFVQKIATDSFAEFCSLPANMPLIDGVYLEDVYYAHYGMFGNQGAFMQMNIPCVRIFSGYYGGFNLSPLEVSGQSNLSGTVYDTFDSLKDNRSDYARQGSAVASLIIDTVSAEGFVTAMEKSRADRPDYTTWTKPLWAYLTVIFAVVALCIALILVVKHFEKKHPFVPQVKRMKIAVFGMDYEDKNDSDIFIDLKSRGPKNPFDGY